MPSGSRHFVQAVSRDGHLAGRDEGHQLLHGHVLLSGDSLQLRGHDPRRAASICVV